MPNEPTVTPYGAWASPITAAALVTGSVGINEVRAEGGRVWWAESRPDEGGRTAVMCDGVEVSPPDANVRTLVHEYGGGAWWPHGGTLFYVDYDDQRLRRRDPDGTVTELTPAPDPPRARRFADGRVTPDGRWCVAVRERHDTGGEPANELVAVATDGSGEIRMLWAGADFVMSPRLSTGGELLAWVAWDHPAMPWDDTRLHVHRFADGGLGDEVAVVGRGDGFSYCEPGWGAGGLRVCADHEGWWGLYDVDLDDGRLSAVVTGPFDIATPPWVFGMQRWVAVPGEAPTGEPPAREAPTAGERLVAVAALPTGDELVVDGATIATADSSISSLDRVEREDGRPALVFAGAGFDHETEVVEVALRRGSLDRRVIRPARPLPFERSLLVEPEWVTFPTGDGRDPELVAHGLFYPPTNPAHIGPAGERPPLLVQAHGGPTAQARRQMSLSILYWTSRGVAVLDVDYRGSTGYGRDYRRQLEGRWGIADVEDCVAGATYLTDRGDVDGDRLIIRGGSAGGFTVLAALAFHDTFAAGASRYGVADLEALAVDTHKFESRYLDSMVGPYPEARDVYVARSPIHHVDSLSAPMIVLQGAEDAVVPPNQAEMIVDALDRRGVPVAYLLFEGEQHGFRQAANIITALESELAFFGRILGFEPAGDLPPVDIRNAPAR